MDPRFRGGDNVGITATVYLIHRCERLRLLFPANSGIFSYSLARGSARVVVKGFDGVSKLSKIVDFAQKTGVLHGKNAPGFVRFEKLVL